MRRLLPVGLKTQARCPRTPFVGFLCLLVLLFAQHPDPAIAQTNSTTPGSEATPSSSDTKFNPTSDVDNQALSGIKMYESDIRAKLYRNSFSELEEIAAELRRTHAKFPGGAWKLNTFYWGVDTPASGDKAKEPEWAMHISKVQKWADDHPDSLTAHVALGSAYVNYAWNARGRGYADTVSEQGWQKFQVRLLTAKSILDKAGQFPEKCPHRDVAMANVAMGAGFERDYVEELFNEGTALEPNYPYLYTAKANYLLPRWHGRRGEMEQFAEQTLRRVGGKEGSVLYYLIAENIGPLYKSDLFYQTSLSWPAIQQGFRDLESKYGMNDRRLNEYCRLAGWASDMTVSQQVLQRIGDRWDTDVWGTQENFEDFKAWAFTSSWKYRGMQWSFPVIIVTSATLIVYRRIRRYRRSKQPPSPAG